jgi:LPXTG-motif cell wall-anchored protein
LPAAVTTAPPTISTPGSVDAASVQLPFTATYGTTAAATTTASELPFTGANYPFLGGLGLLLVGLGSLLIRRREVKLLSVGRPGDSDLDR